ncbi:cytosine permease [Planktothrix sp. FACHB-1355]|uniref:Cytosine permease n=1 Tax=Aerosakkonema funiforme FACHB-1375 TaxID=2949571 RepID=A0A926VA70_9CYAN|nr:MULTISPECIES: cytosine permease [Oscillatoriales]MBD2179628.1 cytosine permease [Aerosakkonema funiforme FACHB-1375]MBD3559410.1 cytosine permease [Planktothrix sp. FACHB-1355]
MVSKKSEQNLLTPSPANEDHPLKTFGWDVRKPMWSLALLLMGFTLYSGTLFAGIFVGPEYSVWTDLLGSIAIGNSILGIYAAALAYIAAKSGLSTALMARFSFGKVGSQWVEFMLSFTQIGWYVWGSAIIAQLLNKLLGVPIFLNWLTILVCTYLFCITAYIGYRVMDWLSRIAVSTALFAMFWSVAIVMTKVGGMESLQVLAPARQLAYGQILTFVIGLFIAGATQIYHNPDFPKIRIQDVIIVIVAFFFANGFLMLCGAFNALFYNNVDIVQVIGNQELLFAGLLLLFVNMWTTQDNAIAAFSAISTEVFHKNKRMAFFVGSAILALLLSLGGIYKMLIPYLIWLGTFIPPIGGVIVSDYWLVHQGKFPDPEKARSAFNWAGISAYGVASAIALFSPGIKPINGIVAAIIIHFLASKIIAYLSS